MCLDGEITDAFTHLLVFAALQQAQVGRLPGPLSALLKA